MIALLRIYYWLCSRVVVLCYCCLTFTALTVRPDTIFCSTRKHDR